jgi:excisionase family DNA binding protein
MEHTIDQLAHYRVEEVAALKGVPYATVRSAILRGEVTAIRSGRDWVVRGADVVAWTPRPWKPVEHDAEQ